MNRINKNTRQAVKRGTQYPAVVVDVHGNKASARLSTNGAIIHNLLVVGGPVDIGDNISVDFTTPEPTIVSVAKEWMTMDDLLRALKKIPTPDPPEPFYELDKIAVFAVDEPAKFAYFPASNTGLNSALGYISDDFDDEGILRHWTVRFPPAGPMMPDSWGLRGTDFWMPVHYHGDSSWGSEAVHYAYEADVYYGSSFENLIFNFEGTDGSTGIGSSYPNHGLYLIWGDAGYSPMKFDYQGYYFKNCRFRSFGYSQPQDPEDPNFEFFQYSCMRVDIGPDGRTGDDFVIFEGCEFYAADGDHPFLVAINEIDYTGDTPSADGYKTKIYLINCTVDCGSDPITTHQPAWFQVYTYNTRWIGVSDITSLPNLTILDDGDRSPIDHTHGVPDNMAFTDLTDVQNDYTGHGGKVVRVNIAEEGLEFATSGSGGGVDYFTDLLDTPPDYSGYGGNLLAVNEAENAIEFIPIPTSGSAAGHITIFPESYSALGGSSWSMINSTSSRYSWYMRNASSGVQNDYLEFVISLDIGIYTFMLLHHKNTVGGICNVKIDGASIGTIDMYGSITWNVRSTITGISVVTAGLKTLRLIWDSKNASSSAYTGYMVYAALWRTG